CWRGCGFRARARPRFRGAISGRPGCAAGGGAAGRGPRSPRNTPFPRALLFNPCCGAPCPPPPRGAARGGGRTAGLGLDPLLARMPSGLEQLVGDCGWQLSHGERSRLFIARALLQPLDVRVLDESFAALDPETLERALACVLRRAETLVVIAHP